MSLSIRGKLVLGCLMLVAANGALGAFTELSQRRVEALGIEIYDRAFMAMSYLRSSQNGLAKLSAVADHLVAPTGRHGADPLNGDEGLRLAWGSLASRAVPDVLSDVKIARERALSPEGAAATDALSKSLGRLAAAIRTGDSQTVTADIESLQRDFDTAVEIYAGDGYHYRRGVQMLIERSRRDTAIAIALSVATAIAIMFMVGRSIVPALREAVAVARAISDGKLDNAISPVGSDEAATLLWALDVMQARLLQKIAHIDALAEESGARAAQYAIQSARFEAALDNMQQGLCMFDAERRLIVANQRFSEMFGAPELGSVPPYPAPLAWLSPEAGFEASGLSNYRLEDGRLIAGSTRPVRGGGWVATYEDVTERHAAEAKLIHMARHDALTGLPNRLLLRERVEDLARVQGNSMGPSVLCLDLDGFKYINDTLGHPLGDELLRSVAMRLQDALDPEQMIARLGGDEFAVVLPTGDPTVAEACAISLIDVVAKPFLVAGHRIAISASAGLAVTPETFSSDAAELCTILLKNADIALYRAKADGKNTHRLYSPSFEAAAEDERLLCIDLAAALERDELRLAFQPLIDAGDGRVRAFEALLRWHHPSRGIVPPAVFIPLAEQTGMITAIGEWVVQTACEEAARWPAEIAVAVNISPKQFHKDSLSTAVILALARSGLRPSRLELEITESTLLQDDETVLATLVQIRRLGVRIALDDFGTGYSSLGYLRRFPLDKIKIDKIFVKDLSSPTNAAILQAVLTLGRALDLEIVAEGVETLEQSNRLRAEGCAQLQGFLFGRPEPAASVPGVIARLNGSELAAKWRQAS